ncbi:BRO1-domain-containing protein [Meredithblackwellia eburnea MCA 4105]
MSNLISIPPKQSQSLPTFAQSLVEHITGHDASIHPDAVTPDAQSLAELRDKMVASNGQSLAPLVAYYDQLSFAMSKLPTELALPLPWYPLFSIPPSQASFATLGSFPTGTPVSVPNLAYERACVLLAIAVQHLKDGTERDRSDAEGIKGAIASFQRAAGVLSALLALSSSTSSTASSSKLVIEEHWAADLSKDALTSLINLALAQAQEAFWLKGVMDRLKNGTIAKLASQVAAYYTLAHEAADRAKTDAWNFPINFGRHLLLKSLHFRAVAQFRKSIDDLSGNRYGDEIARLELADTLVKQALGSPTKGVEKSVVKDLQSLQSALTENIARADKDNRLIYLAPITPVSSLPVIVPASMVKPTSHPQPSTPPNPVFASLVPKEVGIAIKVWDDRKREWFREEIKDRAEGIDGTERAVLEALNLPGALQAVAQPVGLPPSVLAKAQEVREAGGVDRLRTSMSDVRRVARVAQEILDETHAILEDEEEGDREKREKFGTDRWTRPASGAVNAPYRERVDNLAGTLSMAMESDKVVRTKFSEWEEPITVLSGSERDIESSIPSHLTPSLNSTESSTLTDLRRALQVLEDLKAVRRHTVEAAQVTIDGDDVRDEVMRRVGDGDVEKFEEVFEQRLEGFRMFKKRLVENGNRVDDTLDAVKSANIAFVQSRKQDLRLKAREEVLQRLDAAYHKYRELSTNLQEGFKFYSDLAGLLNELRDRCKEWVYARNIESQDHLNAITFGMGGMRLNAVRPGVFDPKKDGPLRFG